MQKKHKIIFVILSLVIVSLGIFFVSQETKFPVEFKVCNSVYESCSAVAKFKDLYSCQTTAEKWGWYCDQTNPEDIKCRIPRVGESAASSFCSE